MTTETFVVIARVPPAGVADFQRYESEVLGLLGEHDATLERRLRSDDGTLEVHVVTFGSAAALDLFRADPRRAAVAVHRWPASVAGLPVI
jgi:hypothetical protein